MGSLVPPFSYAYSPIEENKKGIRKFSARFLAFSNKISTIQKIVLSSSRGQSNFQGLEASRLRPRTRGFEAKDSRLRGQGLQNVFSRTSWRPRTSSRTPPLCTTVKYVYFLRNDSTHHALSALGMKTYVDPVFLQI